MNRSLSKLLDTESLDELKKRLNAGNGDALRAQLLAEYRRLFGYTNILEWNALVRVCEALAILGWGEQEPVEALAKRWLNGAWYTTLQTRQFTHLAGHGNAGERTEAQWVKRGASFALLDGADTRDYGVSGPESQRVPLPKNPIRLARRVANHQRSAAEFVQALSELRKRFDTELAAHDFGDGFSYLGIVCVFSTHDDQEQTVRAEFFHDEKHVPKGFKAKYYVRPRLRLGKLTEKHGELSWQVERHFTRAEGELPLSEQKRLFREDLGELLDDLGKRLLKKKCRYDVARLRAAADAILKQW